MKPSAARREMSARAATSSACWAAIVRVRVRVRVRGRVRVRVRVIGLG